MWNLFDTYSGTKFTDLIQELIGGEVVLQEESNKSKFMVRYERPMVDESDRVWFKADVKQGERVLDGVIVKDSDDIYAKVLDAQNNLKNINYMSDNLTEDGFTFVRNVRDASVERNPEA